MTEIAVNLSLDVENLGAGLRGKTTAKWPRAALGNISVNRVATRRNSDGANRQDLYTYKKRRNSTNAEGIPRTERPAKRKPSTENGLPPGVEDIDLAHANNHFCVHQYAADIFRYLRHAEGQYLVRENHLEGQEITGKMRATLVDWLCDVSVHLKLVQETYHLAVSLVDRYMEAVTTVTKENFQMVGTVALFSASKYEEVVPLEVGDLSFISGGAYPRERLLATESALMAAVGFRLGRSSAVTFLRRYSKAAGGRPLQHAYGKYFVDLALLDYRFCHIRPSMVAAVAVYIALCLGAERVSAALWTPSMVHYTSYYYRDFEHFVPRLARTIVQATDSKLQAIRRKYSTAEQLSVSLMPCLLPESGLINELC